MGKFRQNSNGLLLKKQLKAKIIYTKGNLKRLKQPTIIYSLLVCPFVSNKRQNG